MNSEKKICQNCETPFVIEPEDFQFYERIGVPPPTLCPGCRFQRRLMFRNERSFYKRICDLCSKSIIASYPPNAPFPVYCQKCWWSDAWDPYAYGRDFDFSRPFFEQYKELFYKVPVIALMNDDGIASTGCEYTYDFAFSKNCYLTMCGWYDENCLYSFNINGDKDAVDSCLTHKSELMYECVGCDKSYACSYCDRCFDCRNCMFGYDLRGCSNCVMCVGLRGKSYCILNEQYSKEEYEKKLQEMGLDNAENIARYRTQFADFVLRYPHKYAQIVKSVDSTGDMLINCKMSKNCFFFNDLENCKFMVMNDGAKDCYDCNNTGHPNLCYNCATPDNSYGCISTIFCWKCNAVEYSNNCHGSNNLLGCSALRTAEYSILNKRYSKEEYEALREKIIAHMRDTKEWGEFFPNEFSPFGYNETGAFDWFPLGKEQALERGYTWKDFEEKKYQVTIRPEDIPLTINEVQDSILSEVIGCTDEGRCDDKCTVAFKITLQELQFYRKMKLPLPRFCSNCRHYKRFRLVTPPRLWHRACGCAGKASDNGAYVNTSPHFHGSDHCPKSFETPYALERREIVYCEECYNAEIV